MCGRSRGGGRTAIGDRPGAGRATEGNHGERSTSLECRPPNGEPAASRLPRRPPPRRSTARSGRPTPYGAPSPTGARAAFLRAAAELLEESGEHIIEAADAETALGPARLTGELARTAAQFRAFAEVVDEGAYLDVHIDHPDASRTPPWPDLRRYKIPLGVVAVYAASNFPLAFSVPGGDTASALAACCPVVVKAHPDHPATSELCASVLRRAAADAGLPEDVLTVVHGFDAGVELIRHPLVSAAGFTGSVRGGRALYDAAAARPAPIPFHGELGSLNPVVVTAAAAAERAGEIGTGLGGSMTLGVGQFCTKPGFVLVPARRATSSSRPSPRRSVRPAPASCWTTACGTPSSPAYGSGPRCPMSTPRSPPAPPASTPSPPDSSPCPPPGSPPRARTTRCWRSASARSP
ncbi:N-succinylglutamate 5-semialdehyde dehydrogenase [Streptomyces badius]